MTGATLKNRGKVERAHTSLGKFELLKWGCGVNPAS